MSNKSADKFFKNLGYMIDDDENRTIYDDRNINIIFDKKTRSIMCDGSILIHIELLKAINKKVKELGWLDE